MKSNTWKWTPEFTVGDLHRRLIHDLTVIANICENSNPTYKTRIAQIKAITDKLQGDLTASPASGDKEPQ